MSVTSHAFARAVANRHDCHVSCPEAIQDIFVYLKEFNEFVFNQAGFEPCGDLRGFTGRTEKLDKATTRWIPRGLGFKIV